MLENSAGSSAGIPSTEAGSRQLASPARRSFLGVLLAAGTASVGALLAVPLIRFVLHPLLRVTTPLSWSEVGDANEFAAATAPVKKLITVEQRDGWRKIVSEKAVYVIKQADGQLAVLSSICPHLGCSVAWRTENNEFLCPCHGGLFAGDGKLLGGPPPRGMDRLESKIEEGMLKVHYQYFRQLVPDKEVIA
jgi:quinol---cytochrome c reductase iron-sulfur subunit, bacillus type